MAKFDNLFSKERLTGLKRIKIQASSSGDNTIVAAVTGKKIRVYQFVLISNAAVAGTFQSGAGGTALTGPLDLAGTAAFASIMSGWCPVGHFETDESALLNLSLGTAVAVAGWLVYGEV